MPGHDQGRRGRVARASHLRCAVDSVREGGGDDTWSSRLARVHGLPGSSRGVPCCPVDAGQESAICGSCFRSRRGRLHALGWPRRESKQEGGRPRGWQGPGLPPSASRSISREAGDPVLMTVSRLPMAPGSFAGLGGVKLHREPTSILRSPRIVVKRTQQVRRLRLHAESFVCL